MKPPVAISGKASNMPARRLRQTVIQRLTGGEVLFYTTLKRPQKTGAS